MRRDKGDNSTYLIEHVYVFMCVCMSVCPSIFVFFVLCLLQTLYTWHLSIYTIHYRYTLSTTLHEREGGRRAHFRVVSLFCLPLFSLLCSVLDQLAIASLHRPLSFSVTYPGVHQFDEIDDGAHLGRGGGARGDRLRPGA